jgi:hypothetical protein
MGYSSVQIFGRSAAVTAFRNTDCINWALLQGKQLLFKYEGHDINEGGTMLDGLLKMIAESSGSDAVYVLRWYEREDKPEKKPAAKNAKPLPKFKVYESTPYDGSFNFKLFDDEGGASGSRGGRYAEMQQMKEQFSEMKLLLQDMLKEKNAADADEEKEKVSGIAGMFNGLLDMPEVKQAIAGKVVQIFHGISNKISGAFAEMPVPAKIAGPEPAEQIQLSQDRVNILNSALTILAKADPQLPENLYKLALIAQGDPGTYTMLVNMLNTKK